jgi:hypothetical protein
VQVIAADEPKNRSGLVFQGTEGWVYVTRGRIDAEPKSLLQETVRPGETKLYVSNNHKGNFYECVKSRGPTIAPVEVGHRSCTVCLLGEIAMRLGESCNGPGGEQFVNDKRTGCLREPCRRRSTCSRCGERIPVGSSRDIMIIAGDKWAVTNSGRDCS